MSSIGLFYCDPCILPIPGPDEPIEPLPEPKFVPLRAVSIDATLEGAFATVNFNTTYINPGEDPIETTYEFPLSEDTILSTLTVEFEDNVIETVIKEKEEAEEEFDEVIEAGNAGVLATRTAEFMSLKIGNLLPE